MPKEVPSIIAGPIVRHCDTSQINFWIVTTMPSAFDCRVFLGGRDSTKELCIFNETLSAQPTEPEKSQLQQIRVGDRAYINLITLRSSQGFPENELLEYELNAVCEGSTFSVSDLTKLLYNNQSRPSLVIKPKINKLLHGSCRKPHFNSDDALIQVDNLLKGNDFSADNRPSMLIMSGDQIYADDVAGPMLFAIHQVVELLGLYDESWEDSELSNSQELFTHHYCYYQRDRILPSHTTQSFLFGEKVHPIFTSVNHKNHLVSLSELLAMYFLTWSPELWEQVTLDNPPKSMSSLFIDKYHHELTDIKNFVKGLYEVRRTLAHIPVYMIFDDHDVTDDWNLTRGWEEAAYTNLFSKQIIGNALIGYWLCQGWGNAPEKFPALVEATTKSMSLYQNEQINIDDGSVGDNERLALIDTYFDWEQWNYNLATEPKIVVLDTRTQRWRSESRANKPSGLMDWETLSDFQQELIKEPSVIVVSAAPIYGVKLIETVQRIFTFFGKPLTVDAENWMAHSGTANVILNIFRNPKTPPNFIILSGDVHYSFVYEVSHRFRKSSAKILQVTSSGIKNRFPDGLLNVLEKLNKVLYATYSPLNWFTKRRSMKIRVRKPDIDDDKHLYNGSGIGVLTLKSNDEVITQLITSSGKTINFDKYDQGTD